MKKQIKKEEKFKLDIKSILIVIVLFVGFIILLTILMYSSFALLKLFTKGGLIDLISILIFIGALNIVFYFNKNKKIERLTKVLLILSIIFFITSCLVYSFQSANPQNIIFAWIDYIILEYILWFLSVASLAFIIFDLICITWLLITGLKKEIK